MEKPPNTSAREVHLTNICQAPECCPESGRSEWPSARPPGTHSPVARAGAGAGARPKVELEHRTGLEQSLTQTSEESMQIYALPVYALPDLAVQVSSGRISMLCTLLQHRNQAQQARLRPPAQDTPSPNLSLGSQRRAKSRTRRPPLPRYMAMPVPSASPIPSNGCASRALKSSYPASSIGSQNGHAYIWKVTLPWAQSNQSKAGRNGRPESCPNSSTLACIPSGSSRATSVPHCICAVQPWDSGAERDIRYRTRCHSFAGEAKRKPKRRAGSKKHPQV